MVQPSCRPYGRAFSAGGGEPRAALAPSAPRPVHGFHQRDGGARYNPRASRYALRPPMELRDALETISAHLATPGATQQLLALWREGGSRGSEGTLPREVRTAAMTLDRALPPLTRTETGRAELRACFEAPAGVATLVWAAAVGSRTDVEVSSLLRAAQGFHAGLVATVARTRLLEGPLLDALRCAPFSGDPRWLSTPAHAQARARMDILFWEAGASALQLPELGAWLWGSEEAFASLIGDPARGTLRGRVLAARTVECCATGIPLVHDPHAVSRTLQVLQPLLLHPDAMVWVHAARAVGRIAGAGGGAARAPCWTGSRACLPCCGSGPRRPSRRRARSVCARSPGSSTRASTTPRPRPRCSARSRPRRRTSSPTAETRGSGCRRASSRATAEDVSARALARGLGRPLAPRRSPGRGGGPHARAAGARAAQPI